MKDYQQQERLARTNLMLTCLQLNHRFVSIGQLFSSCWRHTRGPACKGGVFELILL